MTIGEKIKFFRQRSKTSQLELEMLIDASPGSICRIESGKVNPTKETLFAIAKSLNLTKQEIIYLFGIEEEIIENVNPQNLHLNV